MELLGLYIPYGVLGTALSAIGLGLISTWNPSTPSSRLIGYQILLGVGCGLGTTIVCAFYPLVTSGIEHGSRKQQLIVLLLLDLHSPSKPGAPFPTSLGHGYCYFWSKLWRSDLLDGG